MIRTTLMNNEVEKEEDKRIQSIKEVVDGVYKFKIEFITKRGVESFPLRDGEVETKVKEAMLEIDSLAEHEELQSGVYLGKVCYERGRLLSLCPSMESQAEQFLGRASKFSIPGAWTLLGENLYNRGDLPGAGTCFNKALTAGDEKVALRNLSMLMRSKQYNSQEQWEDNINKGVEYARRAVKADPADGESWLVLGNSLLSSFFGGQGTQTTIQAVKAAYNRAESDQAASLLPELYFSKFQVSWYEEQYTEALDSLKRAYTLEPTWTECKVKRENCVSFLRNLIGMVSSRGNLPNKRLQTMIKTIKSNQLGPYETEGSTLTNNKKPDLISFGDLKESTNIDKIIQGKVVSTLIPDSGIPFVMCLVDSVGSCLPVSVYNWARGSEVKIGDSVAIVAPVLKDQVIELPKDPVTNDKNKPAKVNSVKKYTSVNQNRNKIVSKKVIDKVPSDKTNGGGESLSDKLANVSLVDKNFKVNEADLKVDKLNSNDTNMDNGEGSSKTNGISKSEESKTDKVDSNDNAAKKKITDTKKPTIKSSPANKNSRLVKKPINSTKPTTVKTDRLKNGQTNSNPSATKSKAPSKLSDTSASSKPNTSSAKIIPSKRSPKESPPKSVTKVSFKSIRVIAPVMLVVNKRPITSAQVAASYLVSQNKPE